MILVPYLLVMAVTFYIFFGFGAMIGSKPLTWQGIETRVPSGGTVNIYSSKGWDVYAWKKLFVQVKIAVKSAIDVTGLPTYHRKVSFQHTPGPDRVYYIANDKRGFEVIFALNVADKTLYFSAFTASPFSSRHILRKIVGNCSYKGHKLDFQEPAVPLGIYTTDLLFVGGMSLPIFIIVLVFYLSCRKPDPKYFEGDPIRCEENYVYFSSRRKFRIRNSFCYLALTTRRLMIFVFGKPKWTIDLYDDDADITFAGKKMIIRKGDHKITLKLTDPEEWKNCLSRFA
jgi:hypothetical protein